MAIALNHFAVSKLKTLGSFGSFLTTHLSSLLLGTFGRCIKSYKISVN